MAARLNAKNDLAAREKIRATQLVNRLQNHVDGVVEMSPTQLQAAQTLLRKVLPDLSATDATVTMNQSEADISDAELAAIARGEALNEPESGTETDQEPQSDCA